MRQLGVLCAAAYVALSENVSKLEEDHRKAKIIVDTSVLSPKRPCQVLEEHGVLVLPSSSSSLAGTPLHHVAKRGHDGTVILLLSHGANPLVMNYDCQTPLDLARAKGNSNVVRAIQLCINIQTVANMKISYFFTVGHHAGTPLHHAAKNGLDGTIILLLSHGANPLVMNDDCQIPLDLARAKGHSNVMRAIELREIHGLSILEAFASQWESKKIWAVAIPCDSRNPTNPRKYKLAIYPNLQVLLFLWT
ncbi:Putative E3 ubiquitin-protein ligase XBAT35 [Dendrobium catenatum]|uniref:E3 ubiquitin-protein ligase XBAT35 n=1 Tax=Dendrobium catenatum TaxID=906689 RepID=A0A2I0VGS1_9ASPA|nr:Putative E3 ubiquitin-protein ligase XBAT35 [Dendrobium catenatum]